MRYRLWRTVAFDGSGSLNVPDHERNRSWLGRTERRHGPSGYPRLMLMTLCQTGTRGLIAAIFGTASKGETDYAHDLVNHLTSDTWHYVIPSSKAAFSGRRTRWASPRRCGDSWPSTRPCAR